MILRKIDPQRSRGEWYNTTREVEGKILFPEILFRFIIVLNFISTLFHVTEFQISLHVW